MGRKRGDGHKNAYYRKRDSMLKGEKKGKSEHNDGKNRDELIGEEMGGNE